MARPRLYDNEAILQAAAEIFLREGFGASTARIAKEAGVSEATLFKRFKTKVALFHAAMQVDCRYDAWRAELRTSVGHSTPAKNVERALLALQDKLAVLMPRMMVMRGAGMPPKPPQHDPKQPPPPVRDVRALADYLQAEKRLGRLDVKSPLAHAHQMFGAAAHYTRAMEFGEEMPCSREEYIRTLVAAHLPSPVPARKARRMPALAASLLLFAAMSPAAAEPARPAVVGEALTWKDCVREAALKNPGIEAAWKALMSSEAARKGAYSSYFPQISLNAGASRSYNGSNEVEVQGGSGDAVIVQDGSTGEAVVSTTSFGQVTTRNQYASSYTIGLSVQQQIFDGFRTRGNVDQAKAQAHVALAQLLTQKALASYELKSAFAQLLYAQELIGISASIVDQRLTNAKLVELKYEIGRENKGAMLLSKANLSQARLDLTEARRMLLTSQRQLQTTMGRDNFRPVSAVGELVTAPLPPSPDVDQIARQTPAYFQQSATVDAAKAGITIAQSDFYPQINGTFDWNGENDTGFSAPNSWTVGASATWLAFDGAATYFNVRSARATLEQQRATLRGTGLETAQTLIEDYTQFVNAVEQVTVAKEFLQASALRARIAEAQYRNGLISFQDFDTITDAYITYQRTELQARRDAVIAEAQWEESQGMGDIP